jgi:hypothetical protein
MSVCRLSYPACKAHALCYTVTCGLLGSTLFFHIIPRRARFSEKIKLSQNVIRFCVKFMYEIFPILKKIQQGSVMDIKAFLAKVSVILNKF